MSPATNKQQFKTEIMAYDNNHVLSDKSAHFLHEPTLEGSKSSGREESGVIELDNL